MASGDLISRMYSNFRGVDFRGEEINLVRSPDSLNVWKDYKKTESISTRPGMELLSKFDETIYGIYFYNDMMIVHSGPQLFKVLNGEREVLYTGVERTKSEAFIFNNLWYFKDGENYLQYDGETFRDVYEIAHIPTTTIGRKAGAMSGGTLHEDVNMLSDYRINTFVGNGERDVPVGKSDFYLDVPELENIYFPSSTNVWEILKCAANKKEFLLNLTIDGKPILEEYEDEEGNIQSRPTTFVDEKGGSYCYDVYFYKNGVRISIDGTTNLEEIGAKGVDYCVRITKNIAENTCELFIYYRASAGTYPISISYKAESGSYIALNLSADSLRFDALNGLDDSWCVTPITLLPGSLLPEPALNKEFKISIDGKEKEFRFTDKTSELSGDTSGNIIEYVGGNADLIVSVADVNKLKSGGTLDGRIRIYPAPPAPLTDGQDNVSIMFKKPNADKLKITKCTLLQVFDNRVFFSGNPDYPNMMWHSSLNDPTYCSDLDYYNEGLDFAMVKGMVAGNNALWVFKEPSQANTGIFYHTPATDAEYGKIYPNAHSNISTGCVGKAINFNDDIVFFSEKGMEGISGGITTEQVVAHRSSLIDRKLLAKEDYEDYKDMLLAEWEGYLLIFIRNKVYLADSRAMFTNENHAEYEWFYWELAKGITCVAVHDNILYLGTEGGIYTLTDRENALTDGEKDSEGNGIPIESYWVTPKDKFKHPQYLKTTNKRGCTVEATTITEGEISVYVRTEKDEDFNEKETKIGTFINIGDYFVCRIKRKKWKDIQLKFSSKTRFSLETATLEAFVGGYIKR